MSQQTKAQQYAAYLNGFFVSEDVSAHKAREIAAELRRLDAENEQLKATVAHLAVPVGHELVPTRELKQLRAQVEQLEGLVFCLKAPEEQVERLQGGEAVTVTGKLGDLCSFHSASVRKGDKLYTAQPAAPALVAWQPIETAPKDGTSVLLVNRAGNIASGLWQGRVPLEGWWLRGGSRPDAFFNDHYGPTHWMPLPPPPVGTDGGEGKV